MFLSNSINLRLFFSVDVKNSVSLKLEDRPEVIALHSVLGTPLLGYGLNKIVKGGSLSFPDVFIKRANAHHENSIKVWKRLGDEVIFTEKFQLMGLVSKPKIEDAFMEIIVSGFNKKIELSLSAFCKTIHDFNNNAYAYKKDSQPYGKIFLKGTVWSCFTRTTHESDGIDAFSHFGKKETNDEFSDNIEFISTDGVTEEIIGPGVDFGFRASTTSDIGRLIIGKHLVQIITNEMNTDVISHHKNELLLINLIGYHNLKGFSRLQPIYTMMHNTPENECFYNDCTNFYKNACRKGSALVALQSNRRVTTEYLM